MKFSIIIRCFNKLPIIRKCVDAAINSTNSQTEIILINNHPPYQDAVEYINNINHPRVKVLDPLRNIGNATGFNYGANFAKGEFLVILDDDIIVPKNNWITVMSKTFEDFENLAYVSLIWPAVLDNLQSTNDFKNRIINKSEYRFSFEDKFTVFGCVMLKKDLWRKHFSKSDLIKGDLYGIDGYYQQKANMLGMKTGYILSHMPEHLARTIESDPLYGAYKVIYAFGVTNKEYTNWRREKLEFSEKELLALKQFGYQEFEIQNMWKNNI